MSAILGKILTLLVRGAPPSGESLDGFVDSLLQEFENCRPGLSDDIIERRRAEAENFMKQRFAERGFKVEKLLLRNYKYAENYEGSLREKKVAVQLTKKNQMESLVNEEKAKLKQIESSGNASISGSSRSAGIRRSISPAGSTSFFRS